MMYSGSELIPVRRKRPRRRRDDALPDVATLALLRGQQYGMSRLINDLATDLMAATSGDFDAAIERILQRSGEHYGADRAYVFIIDSDGVHMHNTHEWCADGIEPQRELLQDQLVEATPWWWQQIRRMGHVLIPDVAALPDAAASEREVLEPQGIHSLCAFPLTSQDQIFGFVGFDAVRERRHWTEAVIEFGRSIGGLIGIALGHSRMHLALVESERRYRALFESLADAVIVADSQFGQIVDANPQAEILTGHSLAELRDLSITDLHPDEYHAAALAHVRDSLVDDATSTIELVVCHRDGHPIPVEIRSAGHYLAGGQSLVASLYRDISERKRVESRIRHVAHHDALTGLANRAYFETLLNETLVDAELKQARFALLFMDLDNLKPVNDRLGHTVGDQVLKHVAKRIRAVLRASDISARIGGDEFVVIAREVCCPEDAAAVANKILSAIAVPLVIDGQSVVASISIGIALYPEHGRVAAALYRCADAAMYSAKSQGKNGIAFYSGEPSLT